MTLHREQKPKITLQSRMAGYNKAIGGRSTKPYVFTVKNLKGEVLFRFNPAWDSCPGKRPQGGCNGNPWGSALNWSLFPVLQYPTWKASCFIPWGLGKSVIFRGRVLISLNQDHELMLNGPGHTGERRGISHSPGKLIFPGLSSVMTVTSPL